MSLRSNDLVQFREQLSEEIGIWEAEGLVTSEQRSAILRRYETKLKIEPDRGLEIAPKALGISTLGELPLFVRVLLVLAVVLIGLAAFLVLSFNWDRLSGAVKLCIICAGLVASYAGGIALRMKGGKNWSESVFFLSGILFGVAIWQIGQIFHLPANFPLGLLIWASGVFLLAVVLGSTPLHYFATGLLCGWILSNIESVNMPSGILFHWFHSIFPLSSPALPLFVLIGIVSGIYHRNRTVSVLYMLLFLFWWIVQVVPCGLDMRLTFHVAATGLICIVLSDWLPQRDKVTISLWRFGAVLVLGGLLGPSFSGYWGSLLYQVVAKNARATSSWEVRVFWNFLIPAFDFMLFFALYFFPRHKEQRRERLRKNVVVLSLAGGVAFFWIGSLLIALVMGTVETGRHHHYYSSLDPLAIAGMIGANLMMLAFIIWMIYTGLKRESTTLFFSGVGFFLVWMVIRYIDLFSGFGGMLGASAVFFFCACVLLAIVYFWAKRRARFGPQSVVSDLHDEPEVNLSLPVWLEKLRKQIDRFQLSERNTLIAIVAVALLQCGALGAMIRHEMVPHVSGTTITVSTIPVDPRDLFRGDYVILRYPFSEIANAHSYRAGATVYVPMVQDGEIWKQNGVSTTKPKDGVFLRGNVKRSESGNVEIVFGIESYFVQEGRGREIENAMRGNNGSSNVLVDLVVAPTGQTSIKNVRIK